MPVCAQAPLSSKKSAVHQFASSQVVVGALARTCQQPPWSVSQLSRVRLLPSLQAVAAWARQATESGHEISPQASAIATFAVPK